MIKSEKLDLLFTALCKAQSEIEGAAKSKVNPHFKSNYADLESVWDSVREIITRNGLSVYQTIDEGKAVTILGHTSGQYIESATPLVAKDMNDAQKLMASFTYFRRGQLSGNTGTPQIDDDGNTATQGGTNAATGNTNASTQGHQKTYGSGSVQREPNQGANTNTKTQATAPKGNSSRDVHNQGHGGQNNGETSFNELAAYKVKIKGKHLDKTLSEVSNLEGYKDWWQQQIMDKKQVGPEVKEFIEQATLYLHAKEVKDKMKAAHQ